MIREKFNILDKKTARLNMFGVYAILRDTGYIKMGQNGKEVRYINGRGFDLFSFLRGEREVFLSMMRLNFEYHVNNMRAEHHLGFQNLLYLDALLDTLTTKKHKKKWAKEFHNKNVKRIGMFYNEEDIKKTNFNYVFANRIA